MTNFTVPLLLAGFFSANNVRDDADYKVKVYNYGSGERYSILACVSLADGSEVQSQMIEFDYQDSILFPGSELQSINFYKIKENAKPRDPRYKEAIGGFETEYDMMPYSCYDITGTYDEAKVEKIICQ